MPPIYQQSDLAFLSELYAQDAPDAVLFAEYPSSNSVETQFQNRSKYIIHDPFPPPTRALIKVLGPHHLMCGWGRGLAVASEFPPPPRLIEHWRSIFGDKGCPIWQPGPLVNEGVMPSEFDASAAYITLFPHESLSPLQQVIDPATNYSLHSKEVIAEIDCPQAAVLEHVVPPCIVKLSHGYAGLGNFCISGPDDEAEMQRRLKQYWPGANLVINERIENITGDFGVQFYLSKDGSMVWLGLTEQHFDTNKKWCGGTFSADLQVQLFNSLCQIVRPVGDSLHASGYFGLVGIDVLRDAMNCFYLVDVNPRLTGITPFLMASRIFARTGRFNEGLYQASFRFPGSMDQLFDAANRLDDARVLVLSGLELATDTKNVTTTCHLSVSSDSQVRNQQILSGLADDRLSRARQS
ncbi:biotin carboxylase-like protein [Novipirellula aureliae]|uniref:Biotin carboxylase-like protein n=1 Tax=Novipirellula aureliae TaxID=2527966 RepID=A0A5C6EF50_9BACT|nr:ATP-grasp domain-containing protein [Novipirellula aureliae]TWU45849.1 biotin carboxylase-like protein [Novipirellula aureliae]